MTEGIDILNKIEIMAEPLILYLVPVVIFLSAVICVLILPISVAVDSPWPFVIILFLSIIAIVLSINVCTKSQSIHTGRYRYEVTIGDSVSFEDLIERYNIVDQRGKIYVLEDKEVK